MADTRYLPCTVETAKTCNDDGYDGLVIVSDTLTRIEKCTVLDKCGVGKTIHEFATKIDESLQRVDRCTTTIVPLEQCKQKRAIVCTTGPVTRDYDDTRTFNETAARAVRRCLDIGMKRPLMVVTPHERFPKAELAQMLGALHALYVPIEVQEALPEKKRKLEKIGFISMETKPDVLANIVKMATAIETGRAVDSDIVGSDPERMTPTRTWEYVKECFNTKGCSVTVKVIEDQATIRKEFPLMAAVNRCSDNIPRHHARLIELEYNGTGEHIETLMLVGKGVTMDTGGTDVKTNGNMLGMSRDKGGAACVAGFFKSLDALRPTNLKVVGYMCMVRNSIGANAYTCDEIIKSRSGKRVRVYNTDAEGRMAMVDPLCKMRERAEKEKNPLIMTLATLTGHQVLTYGEGVTAIMENGPARKNREGEQLQYAGEEVGDMVEISRIRREDYDFHRGKCDYEDLRQGNNKPSVQTMRGHNGPAAFLIMGSRIDEHGLDSKRPIRFCHVDMAGSDFGFPDTPNGQPVPALVSRFLLPRKHPVGGNVL